LALAAQRAEREVVGAPVGLMDQAISMLGRRDHALFFDCRTLTGEQVPVGLSAAGLSLVVIDTRVEHAHASGAYADRRRSCEAAAALLGVSALRDATPEMVEAAADTLGPEMTRRARHVVTENARTVQAAELLRKGDWVAAGALLNASHASLRDDFEVSVAELDVAVQASLDAGALGARMTGGGFGGSALAVVRQEDVPAVRTAVLKAFEDKGFGAPHVLDVQTDDGARRVR